MSNYDSALILFSGQRDSINVLLNYAQKNDKRNIALLYLKNVGFRNNYKVPLQMAKEMADVCPNIKKLFVIDGASVQISLIRYLTSTFHNSANVQHLCAICQFCLNYIYVNFATEQKYGYIVSNEDVLGDKFKSLLCTLYSNVEAEKESYAIYSQKNPYVNKCEILKNMCQLSYFHNYQFENVEMDNDSLKNSLSLFIYELPLKYKGYCL